MCSRLRETNRTACTDRHRSQKYLSGQIFWRGFFLGKSWRLDVERTGRQVKGKDFELLKVEPPIAVVISFLEHGKNRLLTRFGELDVEIGPQQARGLASNIFSQKSEI
jgi:hypothetical protein